MMSLSLILGCLGSIPGPIPTLVGSQSPVRQVCWFLGPRWDPSLEAMGWCLLCWC